MNNLPADTGADSQVASAAGSGTVNADLDVIVLVHYYPDGLTRREKKQNIESYLDPLPLWISNARAFLPGFRIALYSGEPDFLADPYVPFRVRRAVLGAVERATLSLHQLAPYPHGDGHKRYSKLCMKYQALNDFRDARSVTFRDIDSPLTPVDASVLLEFVASLPADYGSAFVYLWGEKVVRSPATFAATFATKVAAEGRLVGGGITLKTPRLYMCDFDINVEFLKLLSVAYGLFGNEIDRHTNRSIDEVFLEWLLAKSEYRFNKSITLHYNDGTRAYRLGSQVVISGADKMVNFNMSLSNDDSVTSVLKTLVGQSEPYSLV